MKRLIKLKDDLLCFLADPIDPMVNPMPRFTVILFIVIAALIIIVTFSFIDFSTLKTCIHEIAITTTEIIMKYDFIK